MALVFGKAVMKCFLVSVSRRWKFWFGTLGSPLGWCMAAIPAVGPDAVCLGEAEDAEPTSSQGVIPTYHGS